ncbi:MAG: carboxypeptidase regulatory-like domain-containing protein [Planctomycetes bacterium]|nr:carboxypeptidase regulatory-like domain-containing protein [Planctomycetota bacterium]MBI3847976.1 carboxypeptidase regulatory-like domain-containing protein [Planctomycetota bacterium]
MNLNENLLGIIVLVVSVSNLAKGTTLSGRVVDTADTPVSNVDLDLYDSATGLPVATTGDQTDAQGYFLFSVPLGTFDIRFLPPTADRLADVILQGVSIASNTTLPDTVLGPGFLVTAHVVDPQGVPVMGAIFANADSYTGQSAPSHGNATDANGDVAFVVAPGTRDFIVLPDRMSRLAAKARLGVPVFSDTAFGRIGVDAGLVLSGHVSGPGQAAVAGVEVQVIDEASGAFEPTLGHQTDAAGDYDVVVRPGVLTVAFEAPIDDGLAHGRVSHVNVTSDTTLDFSMTSTPVNFGIARTGRLAPEQASYTYFLQTRNDTSSSRSVTVEVVAMDPILGRSRTVLGPSTRTMPANFGPLTATLSLRIPGNVHPRFRGRPIDLIVIGTDATSNTLLDADVTTITVP